MHLTWVNFLHTNLNPQKIYFPETTQVVLVPQPNQADKYVDHVMTKVRYTCGWYSPTITKDIKDIILEVIGNLTYSVV